MATHPRSPRVLLFVAHHRPRNTRQSQEEDGVEDEKEVEGGEGDGDAELAKLPSHAAFSRK